jgi:hypothetical protein
MANVDSPQGLRPVGMTVGGSPIAVQLFTKDALASPIYRYDVVRHTPDGRLEASGTPGSTLYSGVSLDHGSGGVESMHLVSCPG